MGAPLSFTVYGIAAPAGSKRGFYNPKAKRVIVTDDSKRSRPWKALVSDAALQAMTFAAADGEGTCGYYPPLEGPLELRIFFYVPRPKRHLGKNGVRPSAPAYPAVKPDVSKLVRAVEDALTGIVWRDDAQVIDQAAAKRYGEPARVEITVSVLA